MSERERHWVERVRGNATALIKDVARVRVGIKLRRNYVSYAQTGTRFLPNTPRTGVAATDHNPRECTSLVADGERARRCYTHTRLQGADEGIDLDKFPGAMRYLEANRERLEARRYIQKSEREWFEMWVPQDPAYGPCPRSCVPT